MGKGFGVKLGLLKPRFKWKPVVGDSFLGLIVERGFRL